MNICFYLLIYIHIKSLLLWKGLWFELLNGTLLYIKAIDDCILYLSNNLIVAVSRFDVVRCCRWLVKWAVINARFHAGPCGQEEPLLAFRTGKYALHGHSPTSQPGNGSRESQGKTSRQSGRGERKIRSRIIIFCAVLFIVLLFYSFIYSLYLFAIHSYTCETWLAFVLQEMEREKENISRPKAGR